ncbi:MAG: hypothetical protein HZA78_04045 [Candidatus Schekmanbacteria bacterium]|nr:hypothetical protein [Candidatus Schekmanbacteria bacterium]
MGRLTDDMNRLHSEIGFLRVKRNEAMQDVRSFVNGLKQDMSDFQADVRSTRERSASEMKSNLTDFVVNLRTSVNGLQHEVASELAEMRNIWSGTGTAVPQPAKPEKQFKVKAAAEAPSDGKGTKNARPVMKRVSKPAAKKQNNS